MKRQFRLAPILCGVAFLFTLVLPCLLWVSSGPRAPFAYLVAGTLVTSIGLALVFVLLVRGAPPALPSARSPLASGTAQESEQSS